MERKIRYAYHRTRHTLHAVVDGDILCRNESDSLVMRKNRPRRSEPCKACLYLMEPRAPKSWNMLLEDGVMFRKLVQEMIPADIRDTMLARYRTMYPSQDEIRHPLQRNIKTLRCGDRSHESTSPAPGSDE